MGLKSQAVSSSASHISWTASPHNKKAHEFYKRLGAEVERMDGQRPYFRWAMYKTYTSTILLCFQLEESIERNSNTHWKVGSSENLLFLRHDELSDT